MRLGVQTRTNKSNDFFFDGTKGGGVVGVFAKGGRGGGEGGIAAIKDVLSGGREKLCQENTTKQKNIKLFVKRCFDKKTDKPLHTAPTTHHQGKVSQLTSWPKIELDKESPIRVTQNSKCHRR